MKARATLIQGSLAVAGLVAAWATWQRPKETRAVENGVVLVSASKTSLGRVHFEDGTRFVDLVRTTEGTPRLVVTQGFLPGKTPPPFDAGQPLDAGVLPDGGLPRDAGTPPLPPPEPPPTRPSSPPLPAPRQPIRQSIRQHNSKSAGGGKEQPPLRIAHLRPLPQA